MLGKKQALYHRSGHKPKPLFIVAENEDGTVDLGDEAGEVKISSCKVTAEPEDGCCTKGGGPTAAGEKAPAKKMKPGK